jgi:FkbM family methyltransferase
LSKTQMLQYKLYKALYMNLLGRGSMLCFDVGACVGRISEALLELGHTVVAFEPQSECAAEIKVRCARFKQRLRVEETAMGSSSGAAALFVRAESGQSSLKSAWEGEVTGTVEVPLSTLDNMIQKHGTPHYCKIDVEGWELQVLQGLSQAIPLISFEFHQNNEMMQTAHACLERLSSLAKLKVNITPREESNLVLGDWLDPGEFWALFETAFRGKDQFVYGDIYVRMI